MSDNLRPPTAGARPPVRAARPDDVDRAVTTLRLAFAEYPFTRYTIQADGYPDRLAQSQRLLLERVGLPHGRVWVSEDVSAVAVWTTPRSTGPMTEAATALGPELARLAGDRAAQAAAAEDALAPHRPAEPTWFLGTVGVRPAAQGRGLGRAVLAPGLQAAAAEGVVAYLETSLPDNVRFYARLGFEVTAQVPLPAGPTTWAMIRPPGAGRPV